MGKYKRLRLLKDKQGMWYIQEQKFGFLWFTVLKTYSSKAVGSFLDFSGLEYNNKTGYHERPF
jgi:hypothetical protein